MIAKQECVHTKAYCEENVYKLIERLSSRLKTQNQNQCQAQSQSQTHASNLYAVFISNPQKRVT
jgi:hypothetical protein